MAATPQSVTDRDTSGGSVALMQELKRRRVFRVAGLYLVISWVIAEVSDVVFPALMLPDWTITFVILLLLMGFPVAMLLAWIFDIGPDGIQRTAPKAGAEIALKKPGAALTYAALLVLAMLVLGVVLLAPWKDWFGEPAVGRSSIAVLPFTNLSEDSANDYFSDGMSEELINLLTRVPGLQVAARTSSFAYKDRNVDIRQLAEELGVETVLEGSVRWAGDRVRITAQLIDAENGYHLWSETYNEQLANIFEVQDRIARSIVDALQVTLTGEESPEQALAAATAPTRDVQAYDLYLKGRDILRRRGEQNIRVSIELFQAALGRDPGFAQAYAGLATAYVLLPTYAGESPEQAFALASEAAIKALTLDASLAEAHAVLARINYANWNWTDAETGFFAASGLQPGEPMPHHWYSHLLRAAGRLNAAMDEITEAYELDPQSAVVNAMLMTTHTLLGNDEEALSFGTTARKLGFARPLSDYEGIVALRRNDAAAAAAGFSNGGSALNLPLALARPFADAVLDPALREAFLADFNGAGQAGVEPSERLLMLLLLDARDAAFAQAEALLAAPTIDWEMALFWLPEAAGFRADPRFPALMTSIGLYDYWKRYGWSDLCEKAENTVTCR
jgi:TolB-like protein/tetratricopeptide (TPR) repeat protein